MIELQGQTALVVGPRDAVSVAIAERLSAAGAAVRAAIPLSTVPAGKHAAGIDYVVGSSEGPYTTYVFDDSYPETIHGDMTALGPVDIAIIAPSWYGDQLFLKSTPEDWESAFTQNYEKAVYIAQAVARPMIDLGNGGRIILLSTVAAMLPFIQLSAYGASLAALRALAKMIAVDLGPHRITANVVAQGWVETERNAPHLTPEGREYIEAGIPLKRVGRPQDIANVCLFLASDLAAYVTGAVIPVDGGFMLTQSDGETLFPPGKIAI